MKIASKQKVPSHNQVLPTPRTSARLRSKVESREVSEGGSRSKGVVERRAEALKALQNQIVNPVIACELMHKEGNYYFQWADGRTVKAIPSFTPDASCEKSFQKVVNLYKRKQSAIEKKGGVVLSEVELAFREYQANSSIRDQILPKFVEVRLINQAKGAGLVATRSIPKGTIIGEYAGVLKTNAKANQEDNGGGYCFSYGKKSIYHRYTIDAQPMGSSTRFINHAAGKYANVEAHMVYDEVGPHIVILASKRIAADRELLMDYGAEYWRLKKVKPL